MSGPLEFAAAYWLGSTEVALAAQSIFLATPMIALFMLFPTGQFVPAWTRWLLLLTVPWSFGLLLVAPFDGESIGHRPLLSANMAALFIVFFLAGIWAQIYRYRIAATVTERRQLRWAL